MTSGPSRPSSADERIPPAAEPAAALTITQVVASALAAVTATVLLSWLGVAGTIVGAALASVLTVVGNTVYARSIRHTQYRVLTMRQTIQPAGSRPEPSAAPPTGNDLDPAAALIPSSAAIRTQQPGLWARLVARYGRGRMLVAVTVVLFVGILASVTVVELAAGRPLSDLLRGRPATGTSLFDGGTTGGSSSPHPTSTTTPPAVSDSGSTPASSGPRQSTTPTGSATPSSTSAPPTTSSAPTPSPTPATSP